MKVAALVLALLVSAVQTVGWVECCCILICKHHNDPCGNCKEKSQAAAPHDCCKDKTPQPSDHPKEGGRCAHVEPSSELVAQSAELPPPLFDIVLELPVVTLLPASANGLRMDTASSDSRGSPPPLHLLYSVLLI